MHHLVDRLSPTHVGRLRVLVAADPELRSLLDVSIDAPTQEGSRQQLLALAGIWASGRSDTAERHDELIRERLSRPV